MKSFLIMAIAVILTACAKSNCADVQHGVPAMNESGTNRQSQNQDTAKSDIQPAVAYSDGSSSAHAANQKVGVDVQSPTQATASPISIEAPFGAGNVTKILEAKSAGEEATIVAMRRVQDGLTAINVRLGSDVTLTQEERVELSTKAARYEEQERLLTLKLDEYTRNKVELAQRSIPNLPNFRQILYYVIQQTTAGNEKPNISNEQAESIARVAETAVKAENNPAVTEPQPK